MSPTSPESSNQDSPPTTPSVGSVSDMSYTSSTPDTPNNSPCSNNHQEVILFKDSKENPPPTSQVLVHRPWTEELPILAYVVSLLHALPFIFQARAPPTIMEGEFSDPLNPFKLMEESHKLTLLDLHRMIPVSVPIHPLFVHQHCCLACVTMCELLITLLIVSMALTLLLAVYPCHYRWNHHIQYPISPTSLIPPTPETKYTSLTKLLYYSQLSNRIVIHRGESKLVYNHKTYIPT